MMLLLWMPPRAGGVSDGFVAVGPVPLPYNFAELPYNCEAIAAAAAADEEPAAGLLLWMFVVVFMLAERCLAYEDDVDDALWM